MKILFSLLITALLFFSCKKSKEEDPFVLQFQSLLEKYLVCDSIKTTISGISTIQIIGRGKGEDLMFHGSASYTKYSSPVIDQNFQLETPNKMYYYDLDVDPKKFYIVPVVNSSKLILQKSDTSRIIMWYYTAQ